MERCRRGFDWALAAHWHIGPGKYDHDQALGIIGFDRADREIIPEIMAELFRLVNCCNSCHIDFVYETLINKIVRLMGL